MFSLTLRRRRDRNKRPTKKSDGPPCDVARKAGKQFAARAGSFIRKEAARKDDRSDSLSRAMLGCALSARELPDREDILAVADRSGSHSGPTSRVARTYKPRRSSEPRVSDTCSLGSF